MHLFPEIWDHVFSFLPHLCTVSQVCHFFKNVCDNIRKTCKHLGARELWYRAHQCLLNSLDQTTDVSSLSSILSICELGFSIGINEHQSFCIQTVCGYRFIVNFLGSIRFFRLYNYNRHNHFCKISLVSANVKFCLFLDLQKRTCVTDFLKCYQFISNKKGLMINCFERNKQLERLAKDLTDTSKGRYPFRFDKDHLFIYDIGESSMVLVNQHNETITKKIMMQQGCKIVNNTKLYVKENNDWFIVNHTDENLIKEKLNLPLNHLPVFCPVENQTIGIPDFNKN